MITYLVLFLIVFILGLSIGSFITALVHRLRHKKTIINDRSECPNCKKKLGPFELIPLLSYFIQGGKCKHCGKKISEFYPLVEIFTGILFVLTFVRFIERLDIYSTSSIFENLALAIIVGLFLSIFVFFAAYDYLYQEVPDQVSLPAIVVLIVVNIVIALSSGFDLNSSINIADSIKIYPLFNLISGVAAAFFIAIFVAATNGKGMGGGDIRIAALLGLIASWKGTIVGLYIAFITGSVVGLIIAIKKSKLKGLKLPFVPFLSLGAILGFLFPVEIFSFIFPLL